MTCKFHRVGVWFHHTHFGEFAPLFREAQSRLAEFVAERYRGGPLAQSLSWGQRYETKDNPRWGQSPFEPRQFTEITWEAQQ